MRQAALLASLDQASADLQASGVREQGGRAASGLTGTGRNDGRQGAGERLCDRSADGRRTRVERLAGEFRRAAPPVRGDLSEWGGDFPAFSACQVALSRFPWLADPARLDLAVHCCGQVAGSDFDAASMSLLQSTDPALLRLALTLDRSHPTAACSARPGASRRSMPSIVCPSAMPTMPSPRSAARLPSGAENACGSLRCGWRADVYPGDAAEADWTESLPTGASLASALLQAGEGFAFAAWLADAVAERRLACVLHLPV